MTEKLKTEDLATMLILGKRVGYLKRQMIADLKSLEKAAILYAAANEKEKNRLRWWWIEGVRDYAIDNRDVERMTTLLINKAEEMVMNAQ